MPGELTNAVDLRDGAESCRNFVMITGLLAGLLALSTFIVSCTNSHEKFIITFI